MKNPLLSLDEAERELDALAIEYQQHALHEFSIYGIEGRPHGRVQVNLDGRPVPFTPAAMHELLRLMGLPRSAHGEYGRDANLLHRMVRSSQTRRADKIVRLLFSEGTVIRVDTQSVPEITPLEVCHLVRELPDIAGVQSVVHRGALTQLRVIAQYADHPARDVNDVSQSGVHISVNGAVSVRPYVLRLICLNGVQVMMPIPGEADVGSTRRDPDEAPTARFEQELPAAWRLAGDVVLKQWVRSDAAPVEHPREHLAHLMREAHIPLRQRSRLMARLPVDAEPMSSYQLVNEVTLFAQSIPDLAQRDRLERLGGHLTSLAGTEIECCETCHRPLR